MDAGGGLSLAELYERNWRRLARLAALLVDDRGVGEDIVQEAFIALHRAWDPSRSEASALAFLRTVVVNRSRSVLRHRGVVRRHQATLRLEEGVVSDPADAVGDSEVVTALRSLPRRMQEVLVLRYWDDLSEAETAAALGISTGTVKSSASRGLAKLEKMLEGRR